MSAFQRRALVAAAFAVVVAWLVATSLRPPGPAGRSSASEARQGQPLAAPDVTGPGSTGCGAPTEAAHGTTTQQYVRSDGRPRTYLLHIPDAYRDGRPVPLVLAFHGRGRTPESFAASSGLSDAPAVVAYPRGVTTSDGSTDWQGAPWSAPRVSDLALIDRLVDELEHTACIDRDRVYVVGHSNGGNLAAQAACAMPGTIAAAATYGGAFYGQQAICDRAPTAVLEMHSVDDPVVPYGGTRLPMTTLPSIPDLVQAQAGINGCRPEPRRSVLDDVVTRYTYTGCDDGERVEHVRVRETNHAMPAPQDLGGLSFAHLVWQFLLGQRLHH